MDQYQIAYFTFLIMLGGAFILRLKKKDYEIRKLRRQLETLKIYTLDDFLNRGKLSELGLVTAGITHELSHPLSIILARLRQLLRIDHQADSREEIKNGLQQINANAEKMAVIIKKTREYISRNDEEIEEYISLEEILKNVLLFYEQRLKNHDIELRLKNTAKMYVSGHKGQFEQAIINLISNSFDAIENLSEKWIEISATTDGDNVKIFVKDSGVEIPADVRSKMLDTFFTTKKNKGSGLGLSLVKSIAQKHGGDLKYLEDDHTIFMLQLPAASSMQYHQ